MTRSLIEADAFPIEFVSAIAERESWRKEIHRPIYHVHKWWAKRLGSVFRSILLGCTLDEADDLAEAFVRRRAFPGKTVLDPFLGSGTTVGEAHKLGFTALGRDINPVAVRAVRTALGPLDYVALENAFRELAAGVGKEIRALFFTEDREGAPAEALYFFWVMQARCRDCNLAVDLLPSYVFARHAYPGRHPAVQVLCPGCGEVFESRVGEARVSCTRCALTFAPEAGTTQGAFGRCSRCSARFRVLDAMRGSAGPPAFRMYAKLVLTGDGSKQYLGISDLDRARYEQAVERLRVEERDGHIALPTLELQHGYNTRQAMSYGFTAWRDFFNPRQLLALGLLHRAIHDLRDPSTREAFLTLFSGLLEFNNRFASYKGEGTGAVRHMFSHHILKPERVPIEANVWGTPKSSGAFVGLFKTRLMRAIGYRMSPTEIDQHGDSHVSSAPFPGRVEHAWPTDGVLQEGAIYLSCGDSAEHGLPDQSIDFVVTDPPFFDNVHYSELADFFYAWQQIGTADAGATTRDDAEVQDANAARFAAKLGGVFSACHRAMKDVGLLVFTYHHARDDGWDSLATAIFSAGFVVTNAHPVKSEMSVAAPKALAKDPIQLDIILVCQKSARQDALPRSLESALSAAMDKRQRLKGAGLKLSSADERVIFYGQLLTAASNVKEFRHLLETTDPRGAVVAEDTPSYRAALTTG